MKKIIFLTLAFFFGVFLSVQRRTGEVMMSMDSMEGFEEGEEDERYDQPFKFQEYLNQIKIRDGATTSEYPASYQFMEHRKASAQARLKKTSKSARTQSGNGVIEWKERGPANVPGRTRALVVDPDDATHKTWFAGSVSGGIWKTTDGGATWTWLTPALPNLATTSMAMAASNHNVMYAGTGEGFGNLDGVSGHGVFKSIDRGLNWSLLSNTIDFGDINRLIVDPASEDTVVVVSNLGIYRTVNGGSTWTQTYSGVVQDIDPSPSNFNIQYAGLYHTGVLKSIDGGQSWSLSNTGMSPTGRVELAVSPVDPTLIFASAEGTMSLNNSDMYVSNDSGATWSLVNLSIAGKTVDFLSASAGTVVQGGYDNTMVCDPYTAGIAYVGGVGIYQVKLASGSTSVDTWVIDESTTKSFLLMEQFSNIPYAGGKLTVGPSLSHETVEVRFGPGKTQKAHRFLVPDGSTSGVADNLYSYTDYVDVDFEVWDISSVPARQLMLSFRDQNRNGNFDLLHQNFDAADPNNNSREYVFIHDLTYATSPAPSIMVNGGQQVNMIYSIFPALVSTVANWDGTQAGTLTISYLNLSKRNATTLSVSDPYTDYDGKNNASAIHPDHHNLVTIPINAAGKTYQLLNSNDGGVYVSAVSTSPGTTQGSWTAVGNGYNTSQFYGVDKRPGFDEYFGGLQDNGTQKSPVGASASATSNYKNVIGGDGFEVVWNNVDDRKLMGGYYSNHFSRSLDGGISWIPATTGFTSDPNEFPFISRLAVSKNNPDVLFTPGKSGVWKSINFGAFWNLVPITTKWGFTNFIDADVSAANANIVWAGAGMSNTLSIYVSTDNGTTFNATQNYTGATLGVLTRLATHPTEPNTAFALFSFAHSPKILKTTNLGQTWTDISGFDSGSTSNNGFPDVAVYCLYVRPDDPNIIWAGTEIGIVESLDGGASWNLLTDFPSVSVWDLKGQDDQIVIATHGRGIWTARVASTQIALQNPVITASGTSPQSKFVFRTHLPESYDSTQIQINNTKVGSLGANSPGDYLFKIGNVNPGTITLKVIGYKNGSPAIASVSATQISLLSYKNQYYNYFANANDFLSNGFSFAAFSGSNHKTIQSTHPYPKSTSATSLLRQPIIVKSTLPFFYYSDVALVQPGSPGAVFGDPNFGDYVVVESTRDGLTWVPLENGYNAQADAGWLSAFNAGTPGSFPMEVHHTVNLTNTLAVGDTVLFRLRITADTDATTGWGWSVDEVVIQMQPTGFEPAVNGFQADVYPNPSKGPFYVKYSLPGATPVSINLIDITGRSIGSYPLGIRIAGEHTQQIAQELSAGTYLVQIKTEDAQITRKLIVRN